MVWFKLVQFELGFFFAVGLVYSGLSDVDWLVGLDPHRRPGVPLAFLCIGCCVYIQYYATVPTTYVHTTLLLYSVLCLPDVGDLNSWIFM